MSFGFSIGDFVLLTNLARTTFQNAQKACGARDDLTREVRSLHIVLQRLEVEISKPNSILAQKEDSRREELVTLVKDCEKVLNALSQILTKYNALSDEKRSVTKLWQRVKFGNGEMQDLGKMRSEITTYTNALTLFINLLSIESQGKVEKYMDTHGRELREIKMSLHWITASMQAGSSDTKSVLTSYKDDDKAIWRAFRRELIGEGFSSETLARYKGTIKKYVMELGERGMLDDLDMDEPLPGDSGSIVANSLLAATEQVRPMESPASLLERHESCVSIESKKSEPEDMLLAQNSIEESAMPMPSGFIDLDNELESPSDLSTPIRDKKAEEFQSHSQTDIEATQIDSTSSHSYQPKEGHIQVPEAYTIIVKSSEEHLTAQSEPRVLMHNENSKLYSKPRIPSPQKVRQVGPWLGNKQSQVNTRASDLSSNTSANNVLDLGMNASSHNSPDEPKLKPVSQKLEFLWSCAVIPSNRGKHTYMEEVTDEDFIIGAHPNCYTDPKPNSCDQEFRIKRNNWPMSKVEFYTHSESSGYDGSDDSGGLLNDQPVSPGQYSLPRRRIPARKNVHLPRRFTQRQAKELYGLDSDSGSSDNKYSIDRRYDTVQIHKRLSDMSRTSKNAEIYARSIDSAMASQFPSDSFIRPRCLPLPLKRRSSSPNPSMVNNGGYTSEEESEDDFNKARLKHKSLARGYSRKTPARWRSPSNSWGSASEVEHQNRNHRRGGDGRHISTGSSLKTSRTQQLVAKRQRGELKERLEIQNYFDVARKNTTQHSRV